MALLAVVAGILGDVAPVHAARMSEARTASSTELSYTGSPGEANRVLITQTGSGTAPGIAVVDSAGLTTDSALCQRPDPADPTRLVCGGYDALRADLADGNDQLTCACDRSFLRPGQAFVVADVPGNDILRMGGGPDAWANGPGNDSFRGGGGNDGALRDPSRPDSGAGDDLMIGGPGADHLEGAGGQDSIDGGPGNDDLDGGVAGDLVNGGAGADSLAGRTGRDRLFGGAGEDRLDGGFDNDLLQGGADSDDLYGYVGDDLLLGGPGRDYLSGGQVDDRLTGGPGLDRMFGGPGVDLIDGLVRRREFVRR
jgi:Ca2+-binding RTX toxin-like protein